MTKINSFCWLLVSGLAVSGCAVNIRSAPLVTPSPQIATISPTLTANIRPTQPNVTPTNSLPAYQIPITWAGFNLNGKLIYLKGDMEDNAFTIDIQSLDLLSGVITTIFK